MRNNKYKDLARNTGLFTFCNLGTKLISFVLVPIYTYTLSTSDYGTIDLISTTVSLLLPIFTFNIQDAVLRFCLDNDYKQDCIISTSIKIIIFNSCLLGVLILTIKLFFSLYIEDKYIIFLFISFLSTAFYNTLQMYLKAINKVVTIVIGSLLITALNCILNIYFLLVIKLGINGYLLAQTISSLIGVLFYFSEINLISLIKNKFDKKLAKKLIAYSSPLILNSIAWWLNNASDRYILTFFCGAGENGIYSAAYKIPTILSTIQTIFYNAWSISAITEFDSKDKDGFVGNIYSLYSIISFLGCSLLMIFNIPIASIYYGNDFFSAWKYIPILLVGTIFNGLGLFIGCLFIATKKTKTVSMTTLIGAIINTILNIILIPVMGSYGAALATLIGYFIVWFIRIIKLKDFIQIKVQWQNQIISIALIFIQCCIASTGDHEILQIVLFFPLCIFFKNNIRKFFAMISSNISNHFTFLK